MPYPLARVNRSEVLDFAGWRPVPSVDGHKHEWGRRLMHDEDEDAFYVMPGAFCVKCGRERWDSCRHDTTKGLISSTVRTIKA